MNKKIFLTTVGILAFLMIGCFSPYEKKLPDDPQNNQSVSEFLQNVGEIQPEEKQTLQSFIARMAEAKKTEGYGYIQGTTVRNAIEKQQKFEIEKAAEEERARKAEEEKNIVLEKKKTEMLAACSVTVTKKNFKEGKKNKKKPEASVPATFSMELSFENKGEKDLSALAGLMEFRDSSGVLIRTIRIPLDEEIKAGTTKTWAGDLPFDPAKESDVKMANTPLEELSATWVPEVYTFSDGTFLKMSL